LPFAPRAPEPLLSLETADIPRIHRPYNYYRGPVLLGLAEYREEVPVNNEAGRNPIATLVYEIGQAAQAGWAQTARLIALLAVAAVAVALVIATSR
jgi:hypothetical protein